MTSSPSQRYDMRVHASNIRTSFPACCACALLRLRSSGSRDHACPSATVGLLPGAAQARLLNVNGAEAGVASV